MTTYLISDLHLEVGKPHLAAILKRFLAGPARSARALYLLGDFWDVWIGDDDNSRFVRDIEASLKALTDSGVNGYFMVGNRDFLVREAFALRTGLTLIADPTVVEIEGVRTLLTHGDRYCTDDVLYQRFRAVSRTEEWQKPRLALPIWLRRGIAWYARRKSMAQHKKNVNAGFISDVVQAAVVEEMTRLDVMRLIHGHTHRPGEHSVPLPAGEGERIVLADWRAEGEALAISEDGGLTRVPLK